MGSKEKFWYRDTAGRNKNCLFKYSRRDTGEHWAEKIAAEVATCLRTLHAKVELAEFQNVHGSTTESFARRGRALIHGNEVLAILISDYNPRKKFHQSAHTLDNILAVLDSVFTNSAEKRLFAEYLVLDAVIGNTDRHHENWGFQLRRRGEKDWDISLAPSFDHASSLGRELRDERRDRLMAEDRWGVMRKRVMAESTGPRTNGAAPVRLNWCDEPPARIWTCSAQRSRNWTGLTRVYYGA